MQIDRIGIEPEDALLPATPDDIPDNLDDRDVFVRWVKEGRKYGLGCILVTQQPSSISSQIISQGDNFFVLHLLNDSDLQTLKRFNAYYSDEILSYIRSEPIPGNCYFWSAPNQPFVLPARVCNFESVCKPLATPVKTTVIDTTLLENLTAKALRQALVASNDVWLYPVRSAFGKEESGHIAVSKDYLSGAIYFILISEPPIKRSPDAARWLETCLNPEIEKLLLKHKAMEGFATLAGTTRPVWLLRRAQIKLEKGKTFSKELVDVISGL